MALSPIRGSASERRMFATLAITAVADDCGTALTSVPKRL